MRFPAQVVRRRSVFMLEIDLNSLRFQFSPRKSGNRGNSSCHLASMPRNESVDHFGFQEEKRGEKQTEEIRKRVLTSPLPGKPRGSRLRVFFE